MTFRGAPSIGTPGFLRGYELEREADETAFNRNLRLADHGATISRIFGDSVERVDQERARQEQTRGRLAMTPGVSKPGGPPRMRSVADTPLMQSSSRTFSAGGESYRYDPIQAEEEGAQGEVAADEIRNKAKLRDLMSIPGVNQKMASRMVYGREMASVVNEERQTGMSTALAAYLKNPSAETVAAAVAAGASLNQFPDRIIAKMTGTPMAPERGTPEYEAMIGREDRMRTDNDIDATGRRLKLAAELRPEARDRAWKVKERGTGRVGVLNPDTGEVDWTDVTESVPWAPASRGAAAGGPQTPATGAAIVPPDSYERVVQGGGRPGTAGGRGAPPAPPAQTPAGGVDPSFSGRVTALRNAGMSRDEAMAMLTKEGWDVTTGRKRAR